MIELCENRSAAELTSSLIAKGREPHSIMICGEKGLGKKLIAKLIAQQLLCENGTGTPCGVCRACRMIEDGAHPDFITAPANALGNYKVDDIRALTADAQISPSEGRYKIYLIPDMDKSVQTLQQIQNTLLKLIEEPPESVVVILTAKSKEIFLDTIISRTLILQAEEVEPAAAQGYLEAHGVDRAMAEEAVRRHGGNIGRCLDYCGDEKLRAAAEYAENAALAIAQRSEYGLLKALAECELKKEALSAVMVYLQRIMRDACRMRAGAPAPRVFSQKVCGALSESFTTARLADIYDTTGEFLRRIAGNGLLSAIPAAYTASIFA